MADVLARFEEEAGDGFSGDAACVSLSYANELKSEIERLRAALNEVLTNGRWTEGEQRGEWAIAPEIYMTGRDALPGGMTGQISDKRTEEPK